MITCQCTIRFGQCMYNWDLFMIIRNTTYFSDQESIESLCLCSPLHYHFPALLHTPCMSLCSRCVAQIYQRPCIVAGSTHTYAGMYWYWMRRVPAGECGASRGPLNYMNKGDVMVLRILHTCLHSPILKLSRKSYGPASKGRPSLVTSTSVPLCPGTIVFHVSAAPSQHYLKKDQYIVTRFICVQALVIHLVTSNGSHYFHPSPDEINDASSVTDVPNGLLHQG